MLDDNSKVTSQVLQLSLVLYIFKFALYFNSIIISNQIRYYLAINRGYFLQIQHGFYRNTFLIHYQLWWLVIERACTKNSRKLVLRTWLFGALWWKFATAWLLYEVIQVSLLFWQEELSQGWHSALAQGHVISNHYKSLQRFQGRSAF